MNYLNNNIQQLLSKHQKKIEMIAELRLVVLEQEHGTIDFVILGFVKGAESNIDTKRNELITAIETAIETDITRNGNALDSEVIQVETDEGSLFPVGGIRMTIRCMYEYQAGTP
jgi:hypothetical protein